MEIISRSIALLLLFILSPIILLIAILCFIFQGSPVFFKQKRVGFNFKIFEIYKFRTMTDSDSGGLITLIDDKRITLIGNLLRKTKLDEVPQLINILKGEMRFIGPRPEVPKFYDEKSFQFLKLIKPGISDYSSIIFRNESRILAKIGGDNPYLKLLPIKLKLADYYSKKKNFMLDLKLVLITIVSIILPGFSSKYLVLPQISNEITGLKSFINKYMF